MKIIDISEHQGNIDWNKLREQYDACKLHGVMIRAGRGLGITDKKWQHNIAQANKLGIPAGVYWYSQAVKAQEAEREAQYCIDAIRGHKIELPVAYDLEEYTITHYMQPKGVKPTKSLCTAMASAFLSEIEKEGYYALLYTNLNFSTNYFDMTQLKRYGLWWAQYTKIVDVKKPPRRCSMWQWGGSDVPGINGNVDTNEAYYDFKTIIAENGLNHLNSTAGAGEDKPWYADAMEWAKNTGINDGTRPEETATRAEITQMLYNYERKHMEVL